jgi:hypothetical protein
MMRASPAPVSELRIQQQWPSTEGHFLFPYLSKP